MHVLRDRDWGRISLSSRGFAGIQTINGLALFPIIEDDDDEEEEEEEEEEDDDE